MKRSVIMNFAILALLTLTTLGLSGCYPYEGDPSYHYARYGGGHDRD